MDGPVPLLSLEGVSKRFRRGKRGGRERVALRNVSLELAEGELVAVWGLRRSGRTTLLQVAAGVERPTDGKVRFDGEDLARRSVIGDPGGIAYCSMRFADSVGDTVVEQLASPLLNGSRSVLQAQSMAHELLRRVGASECAEMDVEDLDPAEAVRVSIARALATKPRLLMIDDPTRGVPPARARRDLLALLRSIASRDRVTVLMTFDDAADISGTDRTLSLDTGELRGATTRPTATMVPLRRDA
jgi:ABC-type multidrug transport system ATPase subunit